MPMPTLLDLAKLNGCDAAVGLIEEAQKAHPEITYGGSRPIRGLNYRTKVRTSLPTAGFRRANEGVAASKSTFENRLVETFILNPRWECDKAIADGFEDGAPAYIAVEAAGIMEAALQALAKQFYYGYGTGGDAKGFPGLIHAYDATNMVVDATGTTASTGSSVWLVRFGIQDVTWVWGNNASLQVSEVDEVRVTDDSGNPYTAYMQEFLGWAGLQVGSIYSIARIKKLTADSGHTLTDDLISEALAKFPVGKGPTDAFMSRRSLQQLQASRTATNPTGAPAPFPTSIVGMDGREIPIRVTDAILDTEALTL